MLINIMSELKKKIQVRDSSESMYRKIMLELDFL